MPAQSPTLSPTLSAMVAGLRGSSSGMPASTLPTRSPPTSAPLVKMPPPRRAKIEISDAPKPSATSASMTVRSLGALCIVPVEEAEIECHAKQRETRNQHAGDGARLEGEFKPAGERLGGGLRDPHVGAHRDIHADEAGRTRQHGADREADRDQPAERETDDDEDHHADDADGGVLALEIGLRALAHGRGNFLHPLAAGIGAHHRLGRPDAVDDREHPTADDHPQSSHGGHLSPI